MADTSHKFPWRRPKIESTNDSKSDKIFLQSVSRSLVKEIFTNAKCVCGNQFSGEDETNYPMFGACGHFKHYDCMQIPVSEQINQKCSSECPENDTKSFDGVVAALIARHLQGFLIAIHKVGYTCIGCPVEANKHPWSNVIRILKYSNGDKPSGGM